MTLCKIGASMFAGSLVVMLFGTLGKRRFTKVIESDPEISQKYKEIARSRLFRWLAGLVIGFALGYGFITFVRPVSGEGKREAMMGACAAAGIATLFAYFFYMLYPTREYLLDHVKERHEMVQAWREMYVSQKNLHHMGALVSFLALSVFFTGMCTEDA